MVSNRLRPREIAIWTLVLYALVPTVLAPANAGSSTLGAGKEDRALGHELYTTGDAYFRLFHSATPSGPNMLPLFNNLFEFNS